MSFRRVFYPGLVIPEAAGGFDPVATFFSGSEDGLITDISNLGTLWQNANGTGAVTAAGDLVGRIEDVSGNGNHLTTSTRGTLRQDGNGKYYIDTYTAVAYYNLTSPMTNCRSVSMVIDDHASQAYTPLVGHATAYDFHGETPAGTAMLGSAYAAAVVINGVWKVNGTVVTPTTEPFPTTSSVVSVITTGNASAGIISLDRSVGGREFRGKIYEVFLNSTDVGATEMENYRVHLAAKFAL